MNIMEDAETKVNTADHAAYQRWRYAEGKERRTHRLAAIKVARYLTTGELPTIEAIAAALGIDSRRVLDMAGSRKISRKFEEYANAPAEALEGRDALLKWYRAAAVSECLDEFATP